MGHQPEFGVQVMVEFIFTVLYWSLTEVMWTFPQNHNFEKIKFKILIPSKNSEVSAKERYLLKSCNCCCLSVNDSFY